MAALDSTITTRRAREDRTIYRAMGLLEKRLRKPGATMSSPGDVRQFLALRLAQEEREIFAALWLDCQHRLIAADDLFVGTLTQTSVYPREVVKRCLQLNAAAVIFAHNHPSGAAKPSQSDRTLTDALRQALSLVDVRVLDHFIVAGCNAFSFEEDAGCSRRLAQQQEREAEKKKARKPRAKTKATSERLPIYGVAMATHV